jgi:hypothetical protein
MLDLPAGWCDAALASSTLGARHRDWWIPRKSLKNLDVEIFSQAGESSARPTFG